LLFIADSHRPVTFGVRVVLRRTSSYSGVVIRRVRPGNAIGNDPQVNNKIAAYLSQSRKAQSLIFFVGPAAKAMRAKGSPQPIMPAEQS
jgi:hypothetical protein